MESILVFDEENLNDKNRYIQFHEVDGNGKMDITFAHYSSASGRVSISETEARAITEYLTKKFNLAV